MAANKIGLTTHQLEALDRLIARGKDISTDELPGGKMGPNCWLDCVVSTVTVVTMVAGCVAAAYTPIVDGATGGKFFTLDQLKDLRYRATQV